MESQLDNRQHNLTPKPGPQQRQRQRQASQGNLGQFSSPIGRQTRSSGNPMQPTPIRKTPSRPLFDPNSPFVDKTTSADYGAMSMMTPVKADMMQNMGVLTPMHFGSNNMRDLHQQMDSSNIVYVEPGVAVATPEHATTGMVYPGSWMDGMMGDQFGVAGGEGSGLNEGQLMQQQQGSVGPESKRYPGLGLGAGRPSSQMGSHQGTPMSGRTASISGWTGEPPTAMMGSPSNKMMQNQGLPQQQQQQQQGHMRSVSAAVLPSKPMGGAARGVKRLRQVTEGSSSMGMIPPSTSHHHRSISTASVASDGSNIILGNPLTFRPLARMPHRSISSASTATASTWDYPISPAMMAADGSTGYVDAQGRFIHYPVPYHMQHRRNISNMSAISNTTIGTPALDYSNESPAMAHSFHSPLNTPGIGGLQPGMMEGQQFYGGQMDESSAMGQMAMQQQLGGLAIQGEAGQPLELIPEESIVTPDHQHGMLEAQFLSQDPSQYQDFSGQGNQEQQEQGGDPSMANVQFIEQEHQQPMASQGYESSQVSDDGTGPSQMFWQQPSHMMHNGQPLMPENMVAMGSPSGMMNHGGMRHVSTSVVPDNYGNNLGPASYPMPRSVSAGYMPVFPSTVQMDAGPMAPVSMQQSLSLDGGMNMVRVDYNNNSIPAGMMTPTSYVPMPESGGEGSEPPAKRSRVKYPTVGKRLRPGPKPKPKTPKKGQLLSFAANPDGSLPYDPFLDQPVTPTSSQPDTPLVSVFSYNQAQLGMPYPPQPELHHQVQQPMASTSSSQVMDDAALQAIREPISAIPKSYLESCYTAFLVRDPENGGAPVKRYRCNIDDCTREFPRKSAIHSHIQTHLEDKPFVCPDTECNAAFVRQHDLRRHVRIHSGTKPFPCPCGKGFARGDALMRHRQRGICIGSTVPMRKSPKKKGSSSEE